jgi:tetratricopeptide (TPR) repeat protein
MIVKNEAALLQRCLLSIKPVADEIIVVDTGSTDGTQDIALSLGAKVFSSPWQNDFSLARNVSLDHATGTWILWLDADDVVPPQSLAQISELKNNNPNCVYGFVVRNQKPNGTGSEFYQARMFPNDKRIRFERRIHEQMMPKALRVGLNLIHVPIVVEHHGYADPVQLKGKAGRNVELLLKDYNAANPEPVSTVEIADSYTILEDDSLAEQWYRKTLAISECEKNWPVIASQAWNGIGNIFSRAGRYSEAVEVFSKAYALCEQRTDVLYGLAVNQELSGNNSAAITSLQKLLDIAPQTVQVGVDFRLAAIKAYLRLLRLLFDEKRIDELSTYCQKAIEESGHRPEILNSVGGVFLKLRRWRDALHIFEQSIAITIDNNIDAYIGLCIIYKSASRMENLKKTIGTMQDLFGTFSRFYVFCQLIGLEVSEITPVDEESLETERKYLKQVFGLQ